MARAAQADSPRDRPLSRDEQAGFTLIELLVVVVIIGILIAIAVPLYLNYRRGANDKAAQSDLRGAVTTFEQCLSDTQAYPSAVATASGATTATCGSASLSVALSGGTSITYYPAGDGLSYIATTTNSRGTSGRVFCYSSASGGSVRQQPTTATAVTAYRAAC